MTASPTVIRSYRGCFFWLVLQYLACLTVGSDEFYGEQWPVLALGAIWLTSELVTKFSWKLSKRSSGSFAQGLEICYVLAGVAFQKSLFASHVVSHTSERAISHAIAGASKLSFIFFCLPAGELVLLLLVDSLLQLLLFNPPSRSQQEVSADGSLLFLTDALFTALPLLLYCFGPWCAVDSRTPTPANSEGQEKGQEGAHFVGSQTATVPASVKGIMCKSCGNEVLLNLTCPTEAPICPVLTPHAAPGRRRARDDYAEQGTDMHRQVGEPSIERLLVSLVVLLLKRDAGSPGEQGSVFHSAPTPPQVEALRREVKTSRGREPCRNEEATGRSCLGRRADRPSVGEFADPHPNPCEEGRMKKQTKEPTPIAVSPGRRPSTPLQGRGDGAVWICPAASTAFDLASEHLPPHHIHTPFAAERIIPPAYSPSADLLGFPHDSHTQAGPWSPHYGHAQAGPWATVTDSTSKAAIDTTKHEKWGACSPPSHPMAQSEGAQQSLLGYVEKATLKTNQERPRASTGVFQATIPILPALSRPVCAVATPVSVIKKRSSSQPPHHKATRSAVLFDAGLTPPDRLLAHGAPKPEQQTTTHNRAPNSLESNSFHPLDKELAMLIQALGQARQGGTNSFVVVESPQGACKPGGAVSPAVASGMGHLPLKTGQLHLHKEDNVHSSTQSSDLHGIPQTFISKMTCQRGQETPLERIGHYYQQLSSGPEGDQQQHQKQQQLQQHPLQHQKQHEQHAVQHQKQQQPGLPGSTRGSISSAGQGGSERSIPLNPQIRVMRAAVDPTVPIVMHVTAPEAREQKQPPASSTDPNKQKPKQEKGVECGHVCCAAATPASPVQRPLVLDPFAAANQQQKPSSFVCWGRSMAIGANGTPMVSPRKRERTSSLGPGRGGMGGVGDEVDEHRQSALPFGSERHFHRSPSPVIRAAEGEGTKGEGLVEHDRLGKGACMHTGAKHSFGEPSFPTRDQKMQGRQAGNTPDQAYQELHDFAMWRRGRCTGIARDEPSQGKSSPQPHPTTHLPEPRACMQARHVRELSEQEKHQLASRAASTGRAKDVGEERLGGKLPAARRRSSAVGGSSNPEAPDLLILRPGEGKQPPSPQQGSNSRLNSSGSPRPIEPCCPRHSTPTATEETVGRSQHPPIVGPQQQRINNSNGNSWESWEPLLQEGTERSCKPGASVRASRLRAESKEGDEGL